MTRSPSPTVAVVFDTPDLPVDLEKRLKSVGTDVTVVAVPFGPRAVSRIREVDPTAVVVEARDDAQTTRLVESIWTTVPAAAIVALTDLVRPSFRLKLFGSVPPKAAGRGLENAVRQALASRRNGRTRRASPDLSKGARMRLLEYIRTHTSVLVDPDRAQNLEAAVLERMRALNIGSVWEYIQVISAADPLGVELSHLIPSFTITETSFFRTRAHFQALKSVVIPDILQRKRRTADRIRAWSAGCSTGEEPYSLAMTFNENIGDLYAWDFKVVATDINLDALQKARAGFYSHKDLKRLSADQVAKYFDEVPEGYRVKPFLRDLVEFRNVSLGTDDFRTVLGERMDLIFCENVLIYFDRVSLPPLAKRFHDALVPNGYLFLGYSESLYKIEHDFEDVAFENTFFYRKATGRRRRTTTRVLRTPVKNPRPPSPLRNHDSTRLQAVKSDLAFSRDAIPPNPEPPPVVEDPGPQCDTKDPLEALASGDYRKAGELAAAAAPDDWRTGLLHAFILAKTGAPNRAASLLASLAVDHGLEPEVPYFTGLDLLRTGREDDALASFQQALYLDMEFYPAHFQLGEIFARRGDGKKSTLHFQNVLEILDRLPGMGTVVTWEGVLRGAALAEACAQALDSLARRDRGRRRP